jgi:hypothetical protein
VRFVRSCTLSVVFDACSGAVSQSAGFLQHLIPGRFQYLFDTMCVAVRECFIAPDTHLNTPWYFFRYTDIVQAVFPAVPQVYLFSSFDTDVTATPVADPNGKATDYHPGLVFNTSVRHGHVHLRGNCSAHDVACYNTIRLIYCTDLCDCLQLTGLRTDRTPPPPTRRTAATMPGSSPPSSARSRYAKCFRLVCVVPQCCAIVVMFMSGGSQR